MNQVKRFEDIRIVEINIGSDTVPMFMPHIECDALRVIPDKPIVRVDGTPSKPKEPPVEPPKPKAPKLPKVGVNKNKVWVVCDEVTPLEDRIQSHKELIALEKARIKRKELLKRRRML